MSTGTIATDYSTKIAGLKGILQDSENAYSRQHLQVASYHSVVELAHLQAVSLFETFLEELFIDCMLGSSGQPGVAGALAPTSRAEVELMIYAEGRRRQKYLSWLPFGETLDRATAYLVDGQPFSRLKYRPTELGAMTEAVTVRNAVAHASGHAFEQLKSLATGRSYQVSRPADYLLSTRSGDSEVMLNLTMLDLIANGLASASETVADTILNAEKIFSDSEKSPPGNYVCQSCTIAVKSQSAVGQLGNCSSCAGPPSTCSSCGRRQGRHSTQWRRLL